MFLFQLLNYILGIFIYKIKYFNFSLLIKDETVADDEEFEGLDHSMPYYDQRLQEIAITFNPFLNVNAGHIHSFDDYLYTQLIQYPQVHNHLFDR